MHTIPHTLIRDGQYLYNRRVPVKAQNRYGRLIRFRIGSDPQVVELVAVRITDLLSRSFNDGTVLDYKAIAESLRPKEEKYSYWLEEYLELRRIATKPPHLAARTLFAVCGDRDVADYCRDDARAVVSYLSKSGVSTSTVRKRINSISAVMNYAYAELDIEKRNPFSRVYIKGEGLDVKKRGTFTHEQLIAGYKEALSSGSTVKLLMPLLGETGCRISEIVGLRVEDIDLESAVIHIRSHAHRGLKTASSERTLPLVGAALEALSTVLKQSDGVWLFPRYYDASGFKGTHASNAINKWLKQRFDGLTAHSLRHTMRDRLREVEAPLELIDQIGGWSSVSNVGSRYGSGYKVEQLHIWLDRVSIPLSNCRFNP